MNAEIIINSTILITAIASLITAIVALRNVRELKLTRIASVVPRLSLLNNEFVIKCSNSDTGLFPKEVIPSIEIMNFGNGPAINAEVVWQIDNGQIVELLKRYDPHDEFKIGIGKSPFVDEDALKLYSFHFHKRQINELIKVIYPSIKKGECFLEMPSYYFEAFHLYAALAVHRRPEKKKYFEIDPFVPSNVSITFGDLSGEKITENYRVELHYCHNGAQRISSEGQYACKLRVIKAE